MSRRLIPGSVNYVLKSGHERETKQSRQIGKLGWKLAVMSAEYCAVTAHVANSETAGADAWISIPVRAIRP